MMSIQQPTHLQQIMTPNQGASMNVTPFHSASLYVGDLDPEISEATLFEIFNQVGPVASIRVCRDAVTRRSLGYSYVNFHNVADAERALDTMNFSLINGNPCRIMWSQRDPSMRRSGVGNIFVKNLDPSVDNKALYDTFSLFGNILSCKVVTDENSDSKGYGYVHYETAESANQAIERINGMMIAGQQVQVGHFVRRNERPNNADWTNIYVKNIPLSWDEDKLRTEFGKYGDITSIKIQSEKTENGVVSKGFGFINYVDHSSAALAVEEMNDRVVEGFDDNAETADDTSRKLFCCRAQKKDERQRELKQKFDGIKAEQVNKYQSGNLYVKNLDSSISDETLKDLFTPYGTITSSRVMKESDSNESKGFGFVCFSTPEEAAKAVQEMNNKLVAGKPIYVAPAQRKEVRRAQLEAQFSSGGMLPRGAMTPLQPNMYGLGMPYIMASQPSPFQQPQQPRMSSTFGATPQMMPRPPPRGAPVSPFLNSRGSYPIPNYSLNSMPTQPQPGRRPDSASNVSRSRMLPTVGSSHPAMQRQLDNIGGGLGRTPTGPNPSIPHRNVMMPERGASFGAPSNQSQGNFSYTRQVRNRSTPQVPLGGMMNNRGIGGSSIISPQHSGGLTAQALAAASPELQKNMLGEKLYPLIFDNHPELAGKITGMLLEMDNGELLHLLESPDSLKAKICEAILVLDAHRAE